MNPETLPPEISPELLKRILDNPKLVRALAQKSMFWFFYLLLNRYIKKPIAPFHWKMFRLAEDDSVKRMGILAFRGSAKSTIWNTTLALWAIMGRLQKKHVIIVSHTKQRVADHSSNIAIEVEENVRLRRYLGPFLEKQDKRWSTPVRVIPKYGARITFASVEEGVRGVREGPNRPDLIIVDDIEDTNSVRTKEGRDKIFDLLNSELVAAGDLSNTKVVFIGNYLHSDSALVRIESAIAEGKMDGVFLRVPIADDESNPTWPGMFPTKESLEEFRRGIASEASYQLEYMLRFLPKDGALIRPEEIQYYDAKPKGNYFMEGGMAVGVMAGIKGTGVDLAISKRTSADYTALVSGQVIFINEVPKIYIDPDPFKGRIDFNELMEIAKAMVRSRKTDEFYVENVAYQQVAVDEFKRNGLPVYPMQALQDKEARARVAVRYIKNGMVLFPRKGCEELIHQLLYFGQESHDDMLDALVYLILGTVHQGGTSLPKVVALL